MISWFEKHNKISWVITFIGAVLIFYLSSLIFPSSTYTINLLSILYHFFAFFSFAFFLFISSVKGEKRYSVFAMAFILAILYGILDELHQYFVPGRVAGLFDVGIDALGTLFASLIYSIRIEYKKLKK